MDYRLDLPLRAVGVTAPPRFLGKEDGFSRYETEFSGELSLKIVFFPMLFWALILPSFLHAPEESSRGVSATQAMKRRSSLHSNSEDIVVYFILDFLRIPCLRAAEEILGPDLRSSSTSIAAQRTNRPAACIRRQWNSNGICGTFSWFTARQFPAVSSSGRFARTQSSCPPHENQTQPLPLGSGVLDVTGFLHFIALALVAFL